MVRSNQQLEWHFTQEDHAEPSSSWRSLPDEERRSESHRSKRSHFYELILAIAVIYGLAVYFLWQQAERRMSVLEDEVAALQRELSPNQRMEEVNPGENAITENEGPTYPYRFETQYLRFEASARTAEMVKSVVLLSDAKYQQLHRDWGLALPAPIQKLKILVDLAVGLNYPFTDEETLVVPLPKIAAERYGITEVEALVNEIVVRLTKHTFDKALKGRAIKPQWRAMTYALQFYLQRVHGHRQGWQREPVYLALRHAAQTRSIDLARQMTNDLEAQHEEWLLHTPIAGEVADPLIEFLLETYGYTKVPLLLDAFEDHPSWETLAPAVFGISAGELEADWHAYLKRVYPQAKE